ncbi:MAG: CatA-like O-acetyltransferase, family 2 [Bacteroidales bacterium]|nr:CatA-like O-acetyltransferase, family 2 [Bacteroidales bacterium]
MQEIDPRDTGRAYAFEMWMQAPMPMVTLFCTLDITRARRLAWRRRLKLNMLICYCIGRAASRINEFYTLPVDGRLIRYDTLAVSTIVANSAGTISSCDIPWSIDLATFSSDYLLLTSLVAATCRNHDITDSMVIGTSALVNDDIDGAVGMYSGIFNNPFMIWGRYRRRLTRTTLKVSFQFHHTQMDGAHAARFLTLLQQELDALSSRL